MKRSALLLGLFCLASGQALARDQTCDYVTAFERAPFERDASGHEQYRWIEFHWTGNWLDVENGWGWQCRHSPDNASAAFCAWLMHNTSIEFHEHLPVRILTCHGYHFPDWNPGFFKTEFELYFPTAGQILLKTNFENHKKPDAAMRLVVYPQHDDQALEKPLPPMINEKENPVVDPLGREQY